MNQIKKNFIYNVIYQILILILPIVTVPYVSRVLGVDGVGIYSYTSAIASYFMMFALLGINNYGNRTIAKVRDDKQKLSKNFWGIFTLQLTMSIIMILLYICYILIFLKNYKTIAMIQIIYVLSVIFDVNWLFFGLEKFRITVTRSTVLKLISLVFIFTFVKNKNDLWIYTLIMSVSTLLSQLTLWLFVKKEVNMVKIDIKDIKIHIKPCFILFIPVVAISLYKIMDKVMIGILANTTEVGYYEQAEKIINIPMGIVTALGVVMLPRISNLVSKGDDKKISEYMKKSCDFMMFLAFPICFGIISVSSDFIPLFLGNEFYKTSTLIYYIAITIVFVSFASVIRNQYLIPKEKDRVYVISVICGAVINLIINYLLIPKYESVGAAIGTIFAEFFVMFYQILAVRNELPVIEYLKNVSIFFAKSLIMFFFVLLIKLFKLSPILTIILQITIGGLIYVLLNIKYINEIIDIKKILNKKIRGK